MTSRPSIAAPILAVLAVFSVLLGSSYIAAYLFSGFTVDVQQAAPVRQRIVIRGYRYAWQQTLFRPAAWLETRLIGTDVLVSDLPAGVP